MARISYNDFIAAVKSKSPMYGWGVVLAFDRAATNSMLLRSYIKRFAAGEDTYFPRVSGPVETETGQKWHRLIDVQLDKPRLSFANSTITDSRAELFMRSVSGKIIEVTQALGSQTKVIERLGLVNGLVGPTLSMTIKLESAPGSVDSAGKVLLDLSSHTAENFKFSGVNTDFEAVKLGQHLKAQISTWTPEQKKFELSRLRKNPNDALQPREFELRTRAAPGASLKRAEKYGDGDVLMFISLNQEARGQLPDHGVPELLPEGYSSNMLISRGMLLSLLLEELKNVPQFKGQRFEREELNGVVSHVISGGSIEGSGDYSGGDTQQIVTAHTLHFKTAEGAMRLEYSGSTFALRWAGKVELAAMYYNVRTNIGASGRLELAWSYEQLFNASLADVEGKKHIVIHSQSPALSLDSRWLERTGDSVAYDNLDNVTSYYLQDTWYQLRFLQDELTQVGASLDAFRLNGLLFAEEAYVEARNAELVGDLTAVGDLMLPDISIQDHELTLAGGGQHTFTLSEGDVSGVTWTVAPIAGEPGGSSVGTINSTTGAYVAPSAASFNHEYKRVVVTASKGGVEDRTLVHLVPDEVAVYPSVMVAVPQSAYQIGAASVGGTSLTWTLEGNAAGDLTTVADLDMQDGRTYKAKLADQMPPGSDGFDDWIRVQQVKVANPSGKFAVCDVLVIVGGLEKLKFKVVAQGNTFKFDITTTNKKGEEVELDDKKYKLLSGRGALAGDVYTPPADGVEKYIAIAAVGTYNDMLDFNNYLILPVPLIPLDAFLQLTRDEV